MLSNLAPQGNAQHFCSGYNNHKKSFSLFSDNDEAAKRCSLTNWKGAQEWWGSVWLRDRFLFIFRLTVNIYIWTHLIFQNSLGQRRGATKVVWFKSSFFFKELTYNLMNIFLRKKKESTLCFHGEECRDEMLESGGYSANKSFTSILISSNNFANYTIVMMIKGSWVNLFQAQSLNKLFAIPPWHSNWLEWPNEFFLHFDDARCFTFRAPSLTCSYRCAAPTGMPPPPDVRRLQNRKRYVHVALYMTSRETCFLVFPTGCLIMKIPQSGCRLDRVMGPHSLRNVKWTQRKHSFFLSLMTFFIQPTVSQVFLFHAELS